MGLDAFFRNSILRCALTAGDTYIFIRCRKTLDHIFRVSKKKASETQKSKLLKRYSHEEHRSSQIIEYDSQLIQNIPIFMNMCNHTYFMSFQMVYFTQTTTRRKFRKTLPGNAILTDFKIWFILEVRLAQMQGLLLASCLYYSINKHFQCYQMRKGKMDSMKKRIT